MKARAPLALLLLAGCDTFQSAAAADGAHSSLVGDLFLLFLIVTGAVYLFVVAFLVAALFRRRRRGEGQSGDPALRKFLFGWVGATALILAGLTLASWFTDRSLARASEAPQLDIEIVAHQWWWEVRYLHDDPSRIVRTANELHLPAGVPARITLKSNDVIHSFWVPSLAGKQDLIPGRVTDLTLRPLSEGLFRGQCAEFCGMQHAHMALDVTVESPSAFAAWRAAQALPAPPPRTPLQLAGYAYVTRRECASCHNIGGTPANGQVAPDLTHLASRRSLGAGTYPMSRGHLYAWIADPQSAKPGNHMPVVALDAAELHAVVAYLESLR